MKSNTNSADEAPRSDRPEWLSRAKPVEGVRVEVGFLIAKNFYYGPENRYSKEQWEQLREPLYQPAGERYGDFLLSAELKGSAAELVRYYQDVVRLVARHRKDIAQHSHYFWMRPLLFARGDFAINLPLVRHLGPNDAAVGHPGQSG